MPLLVPVALSVRKQEAFSRDELERVSFWDYFQKCRQGSDSQREMGNDPGLKTVRRRDRPLCGQGSVTRSLPGLLGHREGDTGRHSGPQTTAQQGRREDYTQWLFSSCTPLGRRPHCPSQRPEGVCLGDAVHRGGPSQDTAGRKDGQEVRRDPGRISSLGPSAFLSNRSSPEEAGQPRTRTATLPRSPACHPPRRQDLQLCRPMSRFLKPNLSLHPHPIEDSTLARVPCSLPLPGTLGGLGPAWGQPSRTHEKTSDRTSAEKW